MVKIIMNLKPISSILIKPTTMNTDHIKMTISATITNGSSFRGGLMGKEGDCDT